MPTVIVIDGPNFHSACDFEPISYSTLSDLLSRLSLEQTGDAHPLIYWVDRASPPTPPPHALRAMESANITPYLVRTPRVGPPGHTTPKDVDTAIAACAFRAVHDVLYRSPAQIEDITCVLVSGDYDMIHIVDGLQRMGITAYVVCPPASGEYTPAHQLRSQDLELTREDIDRIMHSPHPIEQPAPAPRLS